MSSIPTSVSVQLHVGAAESGITIRIEPIPKDVYDLKKAVKKECAVTLAHCGALYLEVYAAGTTIPSIVEGAAVQILPWAQVPTDTRGENPLIVVAPKSGQQQAQLEQQPQWQHIQWQQWQLQHQQQQQQQLELLQKILANQQQQLNAHTQRAESVSMSQAGLDVALDLLRADYFD